jgi:hypothetical protein
MRGYRDFSPEEVAVFRPILRRTFSGPSGVEALGIILQAAGFFDRLESPDQVAVRNFAVWLLEQLGVAQAENYEALMRAWLALPTTPNDVEED